MSVRALRPLGIAVLVALAALAAGVLWAPTAGRGDGAAMLAGPQAAHAQTAPVCLSWGCQLDNPNLAIVAVADNAQTGAYLTAGGMTLYTNSGDTQPRRTSCPRSGCGGSGAHPLFLLPQRGVKAEAGIPGTFSSFSPYGNYLAVTYNGTPLYFCTCDMFPGDMNASGLTDDLGTWSVAKE